MPNTQNPNQNNPNINTEGFRGDKSLEVPSHMEMSTEEDDIREAHNLKKQAEEMQHGIMDQAEEGLDDDERKNLGGLFEHLADQITQIDEDPVGYVQKKRGPRNG